MNVRILVAILKKDVLNLYPLVLIATLLFAGDLWLTRLDLLPLWSSFRIPLLLLAGAALIFSVFQLDAPVSMVDDWLCRPVPRKELLTAKLVLVFLVIYLSRAVATFVADLILGFSLEESLLDTVLLQDRDVLLQDRDFVLILPILLLTAVVTHTLVQGVGVLFAIFVCVFMIPTPLVHPPGPLDPGIGDGLIGAGLEWLATAPAKTAAIILVAFGYWLVYWRRRILQARVLLVATCAIVLLFVLLPMWLLPWKSVYSLQAATLVKSATDAVTNKIRLRSPRTCFPATRLGDLATDSAFAAAHQRSGLRPWTDEALRDSGPESITFLTGIEARGLPVDWRAKLNYVQADYSVGGAAPLYSLRPAFYITDNDDSSLLSHSWVLPKSAVQRLKSLDASLTLSYSLTLLEPRNFSVPTDGKRHHLPGFGYCSAEVNASGNSIDVDCLSALDQPAQVSAELTDIAASRVYAALDQAPAWARWLHSRRVRLAIGSPRLARHDSITVTAWHAAAYLEKSLSLPGILGADSKTCPLPAATSTSFQKTRWRGNAPHEAESISVDEGVQLEVLDFGGEGLPIVLLPGLGATAHSYDELAPKLALHHRIIAITRRGTGDSSKPDFGFDTLRLGQDVLQVMDAMGLQKVVLIGHSVAGDELTWLGGHHPDRFSGLIYLDAAYDRSADREDPRFARERELNRSLPPEPPIPPGALMNYDVLTKLLEDRGHVRLPEGELIAFLSANNAYLAGTPNIDARTQQAIKAAIQAPDYASLKIPALAIYAFEDPNKPLPYWYDPNDKELLANLAQLARIGTAIQRENIELFRNGVEKGQVLEMQNATHYVFQSNQTEVLKAIEKFVAGLMAGRPQ